MPESLEKSTKSARELLRMPEQAYRNAEKRAGVVRTRVRVDPTDPNDRKRVEEHDEKSRNSANPLKNVSDLFEAVFIDLIDRLKLFGENTEVRYSPYDDLENGVDAIVLVKNPEGRILLAFGLDVTFGNMEIDGKFGRIKSEIDTRTLASIKYPGENESRVDSVPRCIVALNLATVSHLVRLWASNDESSEKILRGHPAIRMILTEISDELKTFAKYSKETGFFQAVAEFSRAHKHFESLIAQLPPPSIEVTEDIAFDAVIFKLEHFAEIKPQPHKSRSKR